MTKRSQLTTTAMTALLLTATLLLSVPTTVVEARVRGGGKQQTVTAIARQLLVTEDEPVLPEDALPSPPDTPASKDPPPPPPPQVAKDKEEAEEKKEKKCKKHPKEQKKGETRKRRGRRRTAQAAETSEVTPEVEDGPIPKPQPGDAPPPPPGDGEDGPPPPEAKADAMSMPDEDDLPYCKEPKKKGPGGEAAHNKLLALRPIDCDALSEGIPPSAEDERSFGATLGIKLAHSEESREQLQSLVREVLQRKTSPLLAQCPRINPDDGSELPTISAPQVTMARLAADEAEAEEHEYVIVGAEFTDLEVEEAECKTGRQTSCDRVVSQVSMFYRIQDDGDETKTATNEDRDEMMMTLKDTIEYQKLIGDFDFADVELVDSDFEKQVRPSKEEEDAFASTQLEEEEGAPKKGANGGVVAVVVIALIAMLVGAVAYARYNKRKQLGGTTTTPAIERTGSERHVSGDWNLAMPQVSRNSY